MELFMSCKIVAKNDQQKVVKSTSSHGLMCNLNLPKAHDRRPKFSVQETRTRNSHEKLGPIYAHKTHKNLTRETWRLMIQTKTLW